MYQNQNDISHLMNQDKDLSDRWQDLLSEICDRLQFKVIEKQPVRMSQWWRSGKIGAVSLDGLYTPKQVPAVLKIQGSKPNISEAVMIEAFSRQNKSNVIRAPKVYEFLQWNIEKEYEATIFEKVEGREIITSKPILVSELDHYFEMYQEYKTKCITDPWIERPETFSYRQAYNNWRSGVDEQSKSDTLAQSEDAELAEQAINLLDSHYSVNTLEFMHGHFQPGDLRITSSGEVVLFSNLFWSYRVPYYDAVFGYHWMMLGMEAVEGLTKEMLEEERQKWFSHLFSLPGVQDSDEEKRKLNLALLERAVPALMTDRFMLNADSTIDRSEQEKIIVSSAREELRRLIKLCEQFIR